jgi:hypothetical protein
MEGVWWKTGALDVRYDPLTASYFHELTGFWHGSQGHWDTSWFETAVSASQILSSNGPSWRVVVRRT